MRIACVQTNVAFNDPAENLRTALAHIETLAAERVDLIVFPEAYLTGYCVSSADEAADIAIPCTSAIFEELQDASDLHKVHLIAGFAENEKGIVRNTAVLVAPDEPRRFYRKTHLPELGLDHFVKPGDDLPVFETPFGKIGILICFDLRAPEPSRILALKGADIIVLPTNWPNGAQVSAELLAPARAVENRVFLASCNRVGDENGFHFIGLSKIIDPSGKILAAASGDSEEVLVADLDLPAARVKRIVTIPGKHETTVFESRRPELYGEISSL
jgi:predicted amidohydrolase